MSKNRSRNKTRREIEALLHQIPPREKRTKPRAKAPAHESEDDQRMNKTESLYAQQVLEPRRLAKEILEYWFEPIPLRLAKNLSYKPDFMVQLADGTIEFHEIKGRVLTPLAWAKLKMADRLYPFTFRLCSYRNKQWHYSEIGVTYDDGLKICGDYDTLRRGKADYNGEE